MIATAQCPSLQTLRRYSLGEYSDAEGARIETHLGECSACEEALAEFDDVGDSLVRHLPLTGRRTDAGSEDHSGWLKRLMTFPPAERAGTSAVTDNSSDGQASDGNFGAYELSGVLGKGGMGVVYAARHRQLGRPVAIKVVNPKLVAAKEAQQRFDREIQVLGALDHPGIVSATDAGRIAGAAYLVMEHVDGADLASIVRKVGPLSVAEACEITRQIALALAAAHDAGAIHRDVKPSNVMIDRAGRVKLLDFGLAHLAESIGDAADTSLGRLLGTLDYMAPEQVAGKQIGPAVDLYGLGATCFYLLAGRPPKTADQHQNFISKLRSIAEEAAPSLNEFRSGIPGELNGFVARLLDTDPRKRPSTASDVADEMSAWTDGIVADSLAELPAFVAASKAEAGTRGDAVRSLSQLLGPEAAEGLHPAAEDRSGRGTHWWLPAILAGFAAFIYFGIVMLIQTDEGTIRIETDVAGVTVELLDEHDRVKRLQIESDNKETQLKAGKYRVRLAGGHDRLTVQPDVIVLSKDEIERARVSVLEPEQKAESKVAEVPDETVEKAAEADISRNRVKSAPEDTLYEGQPESVWQKRFDAETNPVAKIEAAKALLALSSGQPPKQRINRMLRVGGELVQAGWGSDPNDYFNYYGKTGDARIAPTRWSTLSYPQLRDVWKQFLRLADDECKLIGLNFSAAAFANAVDSNDIAEAIFATEMLSLSQLTYEMNDTQSVCDQVVSITVDPQSALRTHLAVVQADYYPNASDDAQREFLHVAKAVSASLVNSDGKPTNRKTLDHWLDEVLRHDIAIDHPLLGNMVLALLLDSPQQTLEKRFEFREFDDGDLPYLNRNLTRARNDGKFWDVWPHLATDYLVANPQLDDDVRAVLATFEIVLRIRKSGDDWPMQRLIENLRKRFEDRTPRQSRREVIRDATILANFDGYLRRTLSAATNHDLLAYTVLAGGELPQAQLRGEVPGDDPGLTELHNAFDILVASSGDLSAEERADAFAGKIDELSGLLEAYPVETVRILYERTAALQNELDDAGVRPLRHFQSLTERGSGHHSPPPIEPLLLLAILSEIVGDDPNTDALIAQTFQDHRDNFTDHLEDALESDFTVRDVAHTWLVRLRGKTTDEDLIEEIDELLPGAARDRATFIDNNPDSLIAVLDVYNEKTREARQTKFDPAISDLTLPQLIAAFRAAAKNYREQGEHRIAQALDDSADAKRLVGQLEFLGGITGTSATSPETGERFFKQYLPALKFNTGPRSSKLLVLSGAELRWSRQGWSSPDWGVVHAPLSGNWKLKSVKADSEELDEKAFKQWVNEHPAWSRIVIENNRKMSLSGEAAEPPFDLSLAYDSPATFELSRQGNKEYEGLFMTNASIDNSELRLTLDMEGGPPPESYRTEGTDAVKLTYQRLNAAAESAANDSETNASDAVDE